MRIFYFQPALKQFFRNFIFSINKTGLNLNFAIYLIYHLIIQILHLTFLQDPPLFNGESIKTIIISFSFKVNIFHPLIKWLAINPILLSNTLIISFSFKYWLIGNYRAKILNIKGHSRSTFIKSFNCIIIKFYFRHFFFKIILSSFIGKKDQYLLLTIFHQILRFGLQYLKLNYLVNPLIHLKYKQQFFVP